MKTALFPGSFDPFTSGHEAIVRRALALFDKVYVAVGVNTDKQYYLRIFNALYGAYGGYSFPSTHVDILQEKE